MSEDFGVFAPVFESAHGYLALLGLSSDDCTDSVRLVRRCANADEDHTAILGLLDDLNWRPTLVGAVAAVFMPYDARITEALWQRFDAGSWVAPQIAVVLAEIDPDFLAEARRRLEARCPLDFSELQSLGVLERHSAAGPAGGVERCAKAACSLQSMVSRFAPPPEWLTAVVASPEHQALVASDIDSAGTIAQRWCVRLTKIRQKLQSKAVTYHEEDRRVRV